MLFDKAGKLSGFVKSLLPSVPPPIPINVSRPYRIAMSDCLNVFPVRSPHEPHPEKHFFRT